ncbi:MAG: sulfatase-like hydrolase/transferase [Promethearchaeota archaeon]
MRKSKSKYVILLTIDALRKESLKSYDYHRNTAPNLEKFVKNGTIFLNAYANGPDSPSSFSAIFTSTLPFLNGGYSPLPSQKKTFPEILKKRGIFTYCIHDNPFLGKRFNYNRGFNIFLEGHENKLTKKHNITQKKEFTKFSLLLQIKKFINYKNILEKIKNLLFGFDNIRNWIIYTLSGLTNKLFSLITFEFNAPLISRKIINFFKKFDGNLFLFAHFMDVHNPYNPPKKNLLKFRKKNINVRERDLLCNKIFLNFRKYKIDTKILNILIDLYDGGINFVDKYLLKIFKTIKAKLKDNCLIIITSDHGEAFYEHELLHHTGNIYDEILKVPLFMIDLGKKNSIKFSEEPVQLIDLAPTILDYFGLEIPKYFQGISLLPLLKGNSINREEFIIAEAYQKNGEIRRNENDGFKLISIRKNNWKYIFNEEINKEYIFDLKSDPYEKTNLLKEKESILTTFRNFLRQHLRQIIDSTEKSKILDVIHKIE